MIDLLDFLETAEIGMLKTGLSYADYVTQFGDVSVDERHSIHHDDPDYGFHFFDSDGIELTFIENQLYAISLDPARMVLEMLNGVSITLCSRLEDILLYLSLSDVPWEFVSKNTFGQQVMIQTKVGVQLSFSYLKGHGMVLSRIQCYGRV